MTDPDNVPDPRGRNNSLLGHIKTNEIFQEPELRRLSKDVVSMIAKTKHHVEDEALKDLRLLLEALLCSAEHPALSAAHRAAACNALYGFLEQGIASSVPELSALCFAGATWERVLELFLKNSANAKAKPMKQVLTTLLNLLIKNPDPSVTAFLKARTLSTALSIIIEHEDFSSVKPAMQVLELFVRTCIVDAPTVIDAFLKQISKDGASLDYATAQVSYHSNTELDTSSYHESLIDVLVKNILQWVRFSDIAPVAGRLLITFFKSLRDRRDQDEANTSQTSRSPIWGVPLKRAIIEQPDLIEALEHYVLPELLLLNRSDTDAFLNTLPLQDMQCGNFGNLSEPDIRLGLIAIGVVENMDKTTSAPAPSYLYSSPSIFLGLLVHASSSIRIAALSIATYSSLSTSLIPAEVLDHLQHTMCSFHAEVDAKARNDFISVIKRLCLRIKGAIARMHKASGSATADISDQIFPKPHNRPYDDEKDLFEKQKWFVSWYIDFLVREMQPTASYQRHITALKIMHYIVHIGLYMMNTNIPFGGQFWRLLLDLSMDPFDDVRHTSTTILKILLAKMLSVTSGLRDNGPCGSESYGNGFALSGAFNIHLEHVLLRAEAMMQHTGRADYADGVGRLYEILFESCSSLIDPIFWYKGRRTILERLLSDLEEEINVAKENLLLAVSTAPLHGHLIALRYIVSRPGFYQSFADTDNAGSSKWRELHDRLLKDCAGVWDAVKDILCLDSPEGHVLTDAEEDGLGIGVKDTLSFSWRALTEASSLMHAMITAPHYAPSTIADGLHYDDYSRLGSLAFEQLAHLRHRGAFSTVSQTFAACCVRCAISDNEDILRLPEDWYQNALSCIQERASALTRRSAGLPAMITGILAAYPGGRFFDNVILDLQRVAIMPVNALSDFAELRLPQVHALNCLKDVFTDTRLGPASESHISITLDIAASCLDRDLWAIQNCGLMLLKALLNRLVGGTNSSQRKAVGQRRISTLVYEKFPNLANLVVRLLQGGRSLPENINSENHGQPVEPEMAPVRKVFPALEIIERAGIPPKHRAMVETIIMTYLESHVWYIREKAARTLSLLVNEKQRLKKIESLLQLPWSAQNILHGKLIYVRIMVLDSRDQGLGYYESILRSLVAQFDACVTMNRCASTVAVYLDIFAHVLEKLAELDHSSVPEFVSTYRAQFWNKWQSTFESIFHHKFEPGLDLQVIALARCLFLLDWQKCPSKDEESALTLVLQDITKVAGLSHAVVLQGLATLSKANVRSTRLRVSSCISILRGSYDNESQTFAMEHLSDLLSPWNVSWQETPNMKEYLNEADNWLLLDKVQGGLESDIRLSDATLRLRGILLAAAHKRAPHDPRTLRELKIWCRLLRLAGDERSELSTRLAAASSIAGFQGALRPYNLKAGTGPELLRVYIALHDSLNDDDEDVRQKGADTTSWVFSTPVSADGPVEAINLSLGPVVAKTRLSNFLALNYHESTPLFSEAIQRLTGMMPEGKDLSDRKGDQVVVTNSGDDRLNTHLTPVKESLLEAMKEDRSLFVEEKQNLFIDEVKESEMWARLIQELSAVALKPRVVSALKSWVKEGLESLIETARDATDGPLGWTSKPEVYTLGMRVILAAEVVMYWARKGVTDVEGGETEMLLQELLKVGIQSSLHVLWLQRIQEAIEKT